MTNTCLPCAVHQRTKTLKEIVDPILDVRTAQLTRLDKVMNKVSNNNFDRVYSELYDRASARLIKQGITENDICDTLVRDLSLNGVFEAYEKNDALFIREIK